MQRQTPIFVSFVCLAALLLGCSSDGGGGASSVRPARCSVPGSTFCVTSCNLGCSAVGCQITDIAQNQPIVLEFSDTIDPTSVNASSLSLQTPNGESPVGDLSVTGNRIEFLPGIRRVAGLTTFGFRANETYILTLPGGVGEEQALRSTSGDSLGATLSCTLNVSRGIIDLDGQPPVGKLTAPTIRNKVPHNVTIVVDFSEIIDVQPFQGATTATSPILYRLRRTRRTPTGVLECDASQPARDLGGVPQAIVNTSERTTQVVLKPTIQLPGEICVEVEITPRVKDLSGKSAAKKVFFFITDESPARELEVVEAFGNDAQQDSELSSGVWGGGKAVPGRIGGDGRMGEFNIQDGNQVQLGVYEWSTDSQLIPGSRTRSGKNITVTDGVFYFSRFEVADGRTLRWVGSRAPQIFVRGAIDVDGTVSLNAPGIAPYEGKLMLGQSGGGGVTGGGRGGTGGDLASGTSAAANFSGQDGEDVALPAAHAYAARAVGTGGRGSSVYPTSGLNSAVTYNGVSNTFSAMIAAGGGGGGFAMAGTDGRVVKTSNNSGEHGPNGVAGTRLNLFPIPSGAGSRDHFLIPGSGGGGGGSHPFFSLKPTVSWRSGGGGLGGGGAIMFRAGSDVRMSLTGAIEVRGGSGPSNPAPPPSPGGGGSGGAVLIQCGGVPGFLGTLDASGGTGAFTVDTLIYFVEVRGGNGGGGMLRLEVPQSSPSPALLGNALPPATAENVGTLVDSDNFVGDQSKFYSTRQVFAPQFLRYELQVMENGNPVLYSDDPAWKPGLNMGLANGPGLPVQFYVQGGEVASSGAVNPGTTGPWRIQVAQKPGPGNDLTDDNATGYRFQLIYDRSVTQNVEVTKVTVFFRT